MKKLVLAIFLIGLMFTFASSGLSTTKSFEQSNSCNINSENTLLVEAANCSQWSLQPNGCYERVCCCDKNGQHWCERCCPDKNGKCVAYKVKC
ncbi:MAG: hypothetical protein ACP5KH_06115 [Thermodesulfovibrio sp.]|jgi:hypothetical protein